MSFNRVFGVFCFILLVNPAWAQLKFEKTSHDFGDLTSQSERFVDIEVKNIGQKKEYFLSFRKTDPVSCLANGQRIDPDSTLFIRLQPNPSQKGKFKYKVEVYVSDRAEPVILEVKGNVLELPENPTAALQACPDFNRRPPRRNVETQHQVLVIDAQSGQPVIARVFLIQQGFEVAAMVSEKNFKKFRVPLNLTLFYVTAPGYQPADTALFLGFDDKKIKIPLQKNPVEAPVVAQSKKDTVVSQQPELSLQRELQREANKQPPAPVPAPDSVKAEKPFSIERYKPLNVVFVVDVSGSMQQSEKLILAKYALNQLVDLLRPEDRIGVVTFATRSELVFSANDHLEKEAIRKKIGGMTANGSTAGVEGLRKGYQECEKAYLPDGQNLLIVITDGAFELSEEGRRIVKKANEKNIPIAVVGVKSGPTDKLKLTEIAQGAGGTFIAINKLADAQQELTEAIKGYCLRK